jgi:uncharacterized caspase-like protein
MLVKISFADGRGAIHVVRSKNLDQEGKRIHPGAGAALVELREAVVDLVEMAAVAGIPEEATPLGRSQEPVERYGSGYAKRIAVVVGIDQYQRWPSIEGAVRDARLMKARLEELGFDDVREVLDTQATRSEILDLLGKEIPEIAGEEDLVVVFFSGHGQTETLPGGARRGYLVPVGGDPDRPFSTAISMDRLRDLADRIPAKHIFFAIDACYSGIGFQRGIRVVNRGPDHVTQMKRRRAVQLITAGTEGQQAAEVDGYGLFTKVMAAGLAGDADANDDGVVTATELGAYVRPAVSTATDGRQTPQYGTLQGTGDVVFGHD